MNATYRTTSTNIILSHYAAYNGLVCDTDDSAPKSRREQLEMQVRSGDYFTTLATTLDLIGGNLVDTDEALQFLLQRQVSDLLYLQQHYEIRKKHR
jgi:hypothetical protein